MVGPVPSAGQPSGAFDSPMGVSPWPSVHLLSAKEAANTRRTVPYRHHEFLRMLHTALLLDVDLGLCRSAVKDGNGGHDTRLIGCLDGEREGSGCGETLERLERPATEPPAVSTRSMPEPDGLGEMRPTPTPEVVSRQLAEKEPP
jgi:hypothetical protein